jgi:hypothetical protein
MQHEQTEPWNKQATSDPVVNGSFKLRAAEAPE